MNQRMTVAAVVLLLAIGCTYRRDGLAHIAEIAGPNAVDCGGVKPYASPVDVNACVAKAFRAGTPFLAKYYRDSPDSVVAEVLVGTPDHKVLSVSYDSAPCGGPGCRERIVRKACTNPRVVTNDRGDYFICD
jgi:hypothetical protein